MTGSDHEHRWQWVEDRLAQLAELYVVSIWAYAVMSNHLDVVIEMHADVARDWGPDEVAARWLRLATVEPQRAYRADLSWRRCWVFAACRLRRPQPPTTSNWST
ncbi:MAG: hypothetical protein IPK27_17320 [Rhodanobacteraceae bacterium]|nr:hypothetical protein [Rhodanobacteraceae bacterium]